MMMGVLRTFAGTGLLVAVVSACAWSQDANAPTAAPSGQQVAATTAALQFEISGSVKSGKAPLPGVTITAANSLTGKKVATSTDVDGSFKLAPTSRGKYVVRAELAGFGVVTSEAVINPTTPTQKVEMEMVLLSRVPKAEDGAAAQVAQALGAATGRGGQQLALNSNQEAAGASGGETPLPGMPALGNSGEAANESLAVSGQMGNTQDFAVRNMDDLRDRIEEMRARGELPQGGGPGGFGGGGGPGIMVLGGPGGFGGGGRGGRGGFNPNMFNKPHGTVFYSLGNSALDATPYSVNGNPGNKPDYGSGRFGFMLGGPLKIPHIYDAGTKTFITGGYTGTRANTPYQVFSTVPTDAERAGDFSGVKYTSGPMAGQQVQLYAPNGTPLGTQLPASMIDQTTAAKLLAFIPHENQPGQALNYRYSAAADTNSDSVNFRVIHNFGASGGGPFGGMGGGRGGGGGGGRGGRVRNNINFGLNWTRSNSDILRPFAGIGGTSSSHGLNVNAGYSAGKNRTNNVLRFNFNQQRSEISNLFAGVRNVGSELQIQGASTNAADWGLPGLSFSNFRGLTDVAPQSRSDRSFTIGDTLSKVAGKHNLRFGGEYRRLWTDARNNSNPFGSFTFTGVGTALLVNTGDPAHPQAAVPGTGYDFADFLMGKAQQTSIQYSPLEYSFLANSWNAFVQDDWRVRGNLTLDLGLRYEYQGPYKEVHGQLVNLDVQPGFTAVAAVLPNTVGPYSGFFNSSLVKPDRNNFAPRVGFAWRTISKMVVRGGYGVNYNLGQYRNIVTQLAYQPPFSFTQTNTASLTNLYTFQTGFPTPAVSTLTNNYGVDPNYRLGYVQVWNLNIQRDLGKNLLLNVGYQGSKGTALDIVRAPNRTPTGLLLPNVQAFLWESAEGSSVMHSGSVRVRKRMSNGMSVGGTYVYAKSIDNASSIGGGATVVAQNDLDLAAERGLSSFDVRHRLTMDYMYEFPFGTGKRWLAKPSAARGLLGDWTWSGDATVTSGSPFTARVLGDITNVAQGVNGTLRASYNGQPISIGDPSVGQWFNTAAFSVPVPGTFGNSGRNTIIGPGTVLVNMALSKSFPIKDMMGFEVRLEAQNAFNHPVYSGIDTTVNSPTFGRVISVGSMRRVQVFTRFRF
jgi:trimeric autotransporter adhesin